MWKLEMEEVQGLKSCWIKARDEPEGERKKRVGREQGVRAFHEYIYIPLNGQKQRRGPTYSIIRSIADVIPNPTQLNSKTQYTTLGSFTPAWYIRVVICSKCRQRRRRFIYTVARASYTHPIFFFLFPFFFFIHLPPNPINPPSSIISSEILSLSFTKVVIRIFYTFVVVVVVVSAHPWFLRLCPCRIL